MIFRPNLILASALVFLQDATHFVVNLNCFLAYLTLTISLFQEFSFKQRTLTLVRASASPWLTSYKH